MIISYLWLGGWIVFSVVLEMGFFPLWHGALAGCQVTLLTALGIGLWRRPSDAVIGGFAAGLLCDCVTGAAFGTFTTLFGLVAWGGLRLRKQIYRDHPLVQMGLAGALSAAAWTVGVWTTGVSLGQLGPWGGWASGAFGATFSTACLAPVWLRLMRPVMLSKW